MTRFYEVSEIPVQNEIGNSGSGALWSAMANACSDAVTSRAATAGMANLNWLPWGAQVSGSTLGPALGAPPSTAIGAMDGAATRNELERLLAAGHLEQAVERFLGTVLMAGLEATLAAWMPVASALRAPGQAGSSVLSKREQEVAALVASGRTNRSIADELFIAPSTVERHVANILNKLGFNSRAQVAAWVVANGLTETLPVPIRG